MNGIIEWVMLENFRCNMVANSSSKIQQTDTLFYMVGSIARFTRLELGLSMPDPVRAVRSSVEKRAEALGMVVESMFRMA